MDKCIVVYLRDYYIDLCCQKVCSRWSIVRIVGLLVTVKEMVLLTDIDLFETKAKEMLTAAPKKTRFSTKYKKSGPVFTMKVTDGTQTYKLKVTKETAMKQSQKVITSLMHMMTSNDLLK